MTTTFNDLFEFGAARARDPETSVEAARKLCTAPLCMSVLKALAEREQTVEELAAGMQCEIVSVSPRLKPLEMAGYVARTDERRKGQSGRPRIVWEITGDGVKLVATIERTA